MCRPLRGVPTASCASADANARSSPAGLRVGHWRVRKTPRPRDRFAAADIPLNTESAAPLRAPGGEGSSQSLYAVTRGPPAPHLGEDVGHLRGGRGGLRALVAWAVTGAGNASSTELVVGARTPSGCGGAAASVNPCATAVAMNSKWGRSLAANPHSRGRRPRGARSPPRAGPPAEPERARHAHGGGARRRDARPSDSAASAPACKRAARSRCISTPRARTNRTTPAGLYGIHPTRPTHLSRCALRRASPSLPDRPRLPRASLFLLTLELRLAFL